MVTVIGHSYKTAHYSCTQTMPICTVWTLKIIRFRGQIHLLVSTIIINLQSGMQFYAQPLEV